MENKTYCQDNQSMQGQNKVIWEEKKILQEKHRDSSEETKHLEVQEALQQQNKALGEEIKALKG